MAYVEVIFQSPTYEGKHSLCLYLNKHEQYALRWSFWDTTEFDWQDSYSLAKWAMKWTGKHYEPFYSRGHMADFIKDYLDDKWDAYVVLESLENS